MIISQAAHTLVSDEPEGLVNVVINFLFLFFCFFSSLDFTQSAKDKVYLVYFKCKIQ